MATQEDMELSGAPLSRFFRFMVYGHVWLAIGVAAQVLWIGLLFHTPAMRPAIALGSAVIAAYGIMRLVRVGGTTPIPAQHIAWVTENRTLVLAMTIVSIIVAAVAVYPMHFVFGYWVLFTIPVVLSYLLPIRSKAGRPMGLRNVPGLKAPLIAAVCTLATIGLSYDVLDSIQKGALLLIAVPQFLFYFAITITYDIADMHRDDPGLKTVPQLLGVLGTKVVAIISLLPWCAYLFMAMFYAWRGSEQSDPSFFSAAFGLPLLGFIGAAVIIARARSGNTEGYFKVWLDGILVFIPLLGFIGSMV